MLNTAAATSAVHENTVPPRRRFIVPKQHCHKPKKKLKETYSLILANISYCLCDEDDDSIR